MLKLKEILNAVMNSEELSTKNIVVDFHVDSIFNITKDTIQENKNGNKYSVMMYKNHFESIQEIPQNSVIIFDFDVLYGAEAAQLIHALNVHRHDVITVIVTDDIKQFDKVFLRRLFNVNISTEVTAQPLFELLEQITKSSSLSNDEKEILVNSTFYEKTIKQIFQSLSE